MYAYVNNFKTGYMSSSWKENDDPKKPQYCCFYQRKRQVHVKFVWN
jgi:hypothetical protein